MEHGCRCEDRKDLTAKQAKDHSCSCHSFICGEGTKPPGDFAERVGGDLGYPPGCSISFTVEMQLIYPKAPNLIYSYGAMEHCRNAIML
ncbi:hypothetical protein BRADI_4g16422v3 [Brachypodium distachyon]|uniref:Uncharacterized protein n=1 Tax=Brachypodium distachyon TaxID=15368 RepID=A0A0Q3HIN5_BRADI|nr:hypothetical protein BRADI_4g16422v3 [Brachypodium distachyon]